MALVGLKFGDVIRPSSSDDNKMRAVYICQEGEYHRAVIISYPDWKTMTIDNRLMLMKAFGPNPDAWKKDESWPAS